MSQNIRSEQRFSNEKKPCPICTGYATLPQGEGKRCYGFESNEDWVYCTREEKAGRIKPSQMAGGGTAYAHKMHGRCLCGTEHNPEKYTISIKGGSEVPKAPPTHPKAKVTPITERARAVAEYDYCDEYGEVLYQVVRYEPKTFRQRRPARKEDPAHLVRDGWTWITHDTRKVLYRLPELLLPENRERSVIIAEGEKDVDTLREAGFLATCNAGGAGKWEESYADALSGRDVIIIPDNDDTGHRHAELVAQAICSKASAVYTLILPGLPEHGDVSDWLISHTPDELNERIGKDAKQYKNANDDAPKKLLYWDDELSQLPRVEWLLEPFLQRRTVAMFAGHGGVGKTTIALDWGLRVAQTDVVIHIAAESPVGYYERKTAWKKFNQLGGAKHAVWIEPVQMAQPASVMNFLVQVKEYNPALIIIDTLSKSKSGLDENAPTDMSEFINTCYFIARETGATVLVIHHTGKNGDMRGASSLHDDVDTVIKAEKDEDGVKLTLEKQRNAAQLPPVAVGFVQVDETQVAVSSDKVFAEESNSPTVSKTGKMILEMLASSYYNDRTASPKTILETLSLSKSTAYDVIGKLREGRYIEQSKGENGAVKITESGRDIVKNSVFTFKQQ